MTALVIAEAVAIALLALLVAGLLRSHAEILKALHELRGGQSAEGQALETLTTAMSTAEAISTGYAAGLHAWYHDGGGVRADHLVQHLIGTALKDAPDDLKKLRHYFNHAVKGRHGRGWQAYYEAREALP